MTKLKKAKTVISSIFPIQLLRKAKLLLSPDYWKFGRTIKHIGEYIVIDNTYERVFNNDEERLGNVLINGFNKCYDDYEVHTGLMRKYVLKLENVIIEPEMGWAILTKNDKLVFDSVSNNSWRQNYYPNFNEYKKKKNSAIKLEDAISINLIKGGEFNYWHFLHDFLGEIFLAKIYLPHINTYIISCDLAERDIFKYTLKISPLLQSCKWILRNSYFEVKTAYFIQCLPNSFEQLKGIRSFFEPIIPMKSLEKKIYLTRSNKRIRHLKNEKEISSLLQKYGFEIIDADILSMQEQIKLFANTRYLVGLHGAGLTNILFAYPASLSVLEILPLNYLQPHYYILSKAFNQDYYAVIGSALSIDSAFLVDGKLLEEKIRIMLGLESPGLEPLS